MPYATATDLIVRFSAKEIAQCAERGGGARLVTDQLMRDAAAGNSLVGYSAPQQAAAVEVMAVVSRSLADATSTIDSHVGGRYSLPMAPVPAILERVACNLARRYLHDDRVTESIKAAYDDDMKLLRDVRDGKSGLGADAVSNEQPASNAGAELVTSGRVWDRESSTGFL